MFVRGGRAEGLGRFGANICVKKVMMPWNHEVLRGELVRLREEPP
jgi:hypothetical protein